MSEKEYVAGFLFSDDGRQVALILKNRPEWQFGKFNAIGGRVETEKEELPYQAIHREFKEETGVDVYDWREFALLRDERGWEVRFFYAFGNPWECEPITDERPAVCYVDGLPENIIPNLRWLIPMALSMDREQCDEFIIHEFTKSRQW